MTAKLTLKWAVAALATAGLLGVPATVKAQEEMTEVTTAEMASLYKSTSFRQISVHDPSVVWDDATGTFYIYGSHYFGAQSKDLRNWTAITNYYNTTFDKAFKQNPTHTVKRRLPGSSTVEEVTLGSYDAAAFCATYADDEAGWVQGCQWAPDIVYNPTMKKWCYYVSLNGDYWASVIVLMTSDSPTGPFIYQAPIVFSGFDGQTRSGKSVDYKKTDLEIVLGTQSSLPSRYRTDRWGTFYPNNIDPCVFFDEAGEMWMAYGSWSGGIFMLKLDKETGLRDYTYTYTGTGTSPDANALSDAYFGKKIAGGYYVSGEGPYIQHIGQYYYLFMSYGGFAPDGGYEMRVFRSDKPNGPYKDASNRSAIFTSRVKNYGDGTYNNGEKLLGAYNQWGFMTVGECAQGHNSIIAAEDGRTYLVYHTKFNDGTAGHQVRVHQVFQNKNGWLVAAPFEYNGEEATSEDVATTELVATEDIPGTYQILMHKYKMDYANMEEVTPVKITLTADGKVTGAYTGTWSRDAGTSYLTIKLGAVNFNGVIINEQMDQRSIQAIAFTAMATNGVNVWGYKYQPKYALAWQLNNQKVPVTQNQSVSRDIDLYAMDLQADNVTLQWTSSLPEVVSDYGKYNPAGLEEDTPLTLTARLEATGCYWEQSFGVKALSEENAKPLADWQTGLVAHYGFDDDALTNSCDRSQQAQLLRSSTTAKPVVEEGDPMRTGSVVHLSAGAVNKESYVQMANPLKGLTLTDGATLSFWVKRTDDNLWKGLFAFVNGNAHLFMTGNTYTSFSDGTNNWLDINQPDTRQTTNIGVGHWHLVTIVFQRKATKSSGGITVYIDGTTTKNDVFDGSINGTDVTTRAGFDYNLVVDHLAASTDLFLGRGTSWGSPDARFDDVLVYNRPLTITEVLALRTMSNRVFDFASLWNTWGDVNGDQKVDQADVEAIISCIAGNGQDSNADVNGDGVVNIADIITLLKALQPTLGIDTK